MLADFDAQPGRKVPPSPDLSLPNGKRTRRNCMRGCAESQELWPAPER